MGEGGSPAGSAGRKDDRDDRRKDEERETEAEQPEGTAAEGDREREGEARGQGARGKRSRGGTLELARNGTRLNADEIATGQRLSQQIGRPLKESPHKGSEFVDDLGRHYDACGTPRASQYWNEEQFRASIDWHLTKSNDFTALDVTGFKPAHKAAVRAYIDSLPPASQAKIIRIGF